MNEPIYDAVSREWQLLEDKNQRIGRTKAIIEITEWLQTLLLNKERVTNAKLLEKLEQMNG